MFRTFRLLSCLGSGSVGVGLRSLSHATAGLTAKPLSVLPRSSLQALLGVDAQEATRRIDALVKKSSSARPFLAFGPRMGFSVKTIGATLLLTLEPPRADEYYQAPPSVPTLTERAADLTNGLYQAIRYVFENRRRPDILLSNDICSERVVDAIGEWKTGEEEFEYSLLPVRQPQITGIQIFFSNGQRMASFFDLIWMLMRSVVFPIYFDASKVSIDVCYSYVQIARRREKASDSEALSKIVERYDSLRDSENIERDWKELKASSFNSSQEYSKALFDTEWRLSLDRTVTDPHWHIEDIVYTKQVG